MQYELANGKKINIPDSEIANNMKMLGLTKQEAIEVWLDDEGYTENAEQVAMTKKAKAVTVTIHEASGVDKRDKPKRTRTVKINPTKIETVNQLKTWLETIGFSNVTVLIQGKLLSFQDSENTFELNLVQKRKEKKKK